MKKKCGRPDVSTGEKGSGKTFCNAHKHMAYFSECHVFIWFFSSNFLLKKLLHSSHWYGFIFLWKSWWLYNRYLLLKALLHCKQEGGRLVVLTSLRTFLLTGTPKEHWSHLTEWTGMNMCLSSQVGHFMEARVIFFIGSSCSSRSAILFFDIARAWSWRSLALSLSYASLPWMQIDQ